MLGILRPCLWLLFFLGHRVCCGLHMGQRQRRSFFATTTGGVEKLLAKELSAFTGTTGVKINKGSVEFEGDIKTGLEALMWLRTPLKVMERVATAKNINCKDALHSWISSINWEEKLTAAHTLKCDTVLGRDNSPDLGHSHFTSLTVKNAIVDQFRNKDNTRPSVDVVEPDLPLLLYLHKGVGTLYRVWSGEQSLHKRGYRPDVVHRAALRETTAAALLLHAGWPERCHDRESIICDPMCGSGTIAVEAALMQADTAPGLLRYEPPRTSTARGAGKGDSTPPSGTIGKLSRQPNPLCWPDISSQAAEAWDVVYAAAQDRDQRQALRDQRARPRILGNDIHRGSVDLAVQAARTARVEHLIEFSSGDIARYQPRMRPSLIVTNPPWDMRLHGAEAAWSGLAGFLDRCSHKSENIAHTGNQPGHDVMEDTATARQASEAWVLSGNPAMLCTPGLGRPARDVQVRGASLDMMLHQYLL